MRGRAFPFRLARQPAPGPAAVRLRLVPVHVAHRRPKLQASPLIEAALGPGAVDPAPVPRRRATGLDERQKLGVGHRRGSDAEGLDGDFVRPFLVVEDERLPSGHGSEDETSARECEVRGRAVAFFRRDLFFSGTKGSGGERIGIAQRLACVVKSFRVHVLVKRGEANEVAQALVVGRALQPLQHALEHGAKIVLRRAQRGQRQVPADVVGDGRGVVERVGALEDGLVERAVRPRPQAPALLEPAHMADLPQRRVDDGQLRPQEARTVEHARHLLRARPARDELFR
jgi:hypothetical protein